MKPTSSNITRLEKYLPTKIGERFQDKCNLENLLTWSTFANPLCVNCVLLIKLDQRLLLVILKNGD